jgi:hypothetical protein
MLKGRIETNENRRRAGRVGDPLRWGSCVNFGAAILNNPLVVMRLIKTTELLRVQEPKSNIQAVIDCLHADGPFESKNDRFDLVFNSKESYGV